MPLESQFFWIKTGGVVMQPPKTVFAYGMTAPKNGTRGFLMCLQAYILKYALFDKKEKRKKSIRKRDKGPKDKVLQPNQEQQVNLVEQTFIDLLLNTLLFLYSKNLSTYSSSLCINIWRFELKLTHDS